MTVSEKILPEPVQEGNAKSPVAPPLASPSTSSKRTNMKRPLSRSLDALQNQAALAALKHYEDSIGRGGGGGDDKNINTKRVGVAILDPFIIESKDTLGALLFGSTGAKVLFGMMKGPSGIVVNLLLVIGAVTTSFAFTKNIPYNYSFVGFLMFPCLLAVASTMNIEIIQQIVICFDSMLLLAYGTYCVAAMSVSCSDARIVTLCLGYLYIVMLVFTDALRRLEEQ